MAPEHSSEVVGASVQIALGRVGAKRSTKESMQEARGGVSPIDVVVEGEAGEERGWGGGGEEGVGAAM